MVTDKKFAKKAKEEDIVAVLNLLGSVYPLSKELIIEAHACAVAFDIEANEVLVEEGRICDYVYFITKGALMAYSYHKEKKITTYISVEREFVSSISGLYGKSPSLEAIIAVEPTSLLAIHTDILQQMFHKYFELNFIFRVFMEQYYKDAQQRAHIIRLGDFKERYLYVKEHKPGFIERLPLEHIASFLDMKPKTLLRIIKEAEVVAHQDDKNEHIAKELHVLMLEREAYKMKDVNLKTVAETIGTTSHKLSSLLNNYYQLSFVDFINSYRISSIKEQMAIPGNLQNYTIEALAKNAGFSSRSSFYNAFKKNVGMSPVEYTRRQ